MALEASNSGFMRGRLEELQRENDELRDQLRRYAIQATVTRSAISDASTEKEATARIAHQVAVEERATRAAVEVQGSTLSFGVVMQVLNFFMLLVLLLGMLVWLPRELENRVHPTVVNTVPGSVVVPR